MNGYTGPTLLPSPVQGGAGGLTPSWVDIDFSHSNVSLVLLGQMGILPDLLGS